MTAVRVTSEQLEVARQLDGEARVTQLGAEVIQKETSAIRVSHLAIEVLRTGVSYGSPGGGTIVTILGG